MRGEDLLDSVTVHAVIEVVPEFLISIPDQDVRGVVEVESLNQLLRSPRSCGGGHTAVCDSSSASRCGSLPGAT